MDADRVVPGPQGTRFPQIHHRHEVGSTNALLLDEARNGAAEGLVLVTDHQTAGRGRQQRTWHDEPGTAMLISILTRPREPLVPLMPFIAGLSVTDAVAEASGRAGAAMLKWPNDVLVPDHGNRKLCGILCEATTTPGAGSVAVVAGIGLNLRPQQGVPAEVTAKAVTMAELGAPTERWTMVDALLRAMDRWLSSSAAGVLGEYRRRCITIGRSVRFATATSTVEGVAEAVADDGGLVVVGEHGTATLVAGDAHHV
ncbi:MAG: biotin--[acetyl-CoA-carboxylase] ligase [Actinomycetota bacterium]